jgi:hypothetical protein
MLVLLPGLRLLTLNANEAARLPKFLTPDEDAELLRFFITKELGTDFPEKLNTCLEKRYQVKDTEQVLFSISDYEQVLTAKNWYLCQYVLLNELFITSNFDIFISKLTFVHGFVEKVDKDESLLLKIQKVRNVKIEISHQADGSTTAEVAATLSAMNLSAFELTCSVPLFIKKGAPMRLIMSTSDCYLHYAHVPWSILDLTSLGDTAHTYFQQLQFKQTHLPIFLQSISHCLA